MRLSLVPAAVFALTASLVSAESTSERPRTLFIALDAVPFDVAKELVDESQGESPGARPFEHLQGPVPVVSSFPSSTTVAFAGFFEPFGMSKPPGYEARFYDLEQGRLRGGGLRSYSRIKFHWKEFFDWRIRSTWRKSVGFLRPIRAGRKEIVRAVDEFFASDQQDFFAYIAATDGAGHLLGPQSTARILRELDKALSEARRRHPPHYTVVFSDHGMAGGKPLRNVRKAVRRAARGVGFKLRSRIRGRDDLALVSYGLLSSFVAFTHPGEESRAAAALAAVPGVSLCASPGAGSDLWDVYGEDGHARIERRRGPEEWEWRYDVEEGDPLGYLRDVAELAAGGFDQEQVWLSDSDWFDLTAESRYPDALYRIARAFDLVVNPASVVCSVAPGHLFGAWLTDWSGRLAGGRLRWTHGALDREDSLGFLMTDHPAWRQKKALRFDESLVRFATGGGTGHRDRGEAALASLTCLTLSKRLALNFSD